MLRYEGLLTPFAPSSQGRMDASAVGEAGRMFEQDAQYEKSRQDRLAKEAHDAALADRHQTGLDEYYSAQAATHRLQVEQSKGAAEEKRLGALMDALRKAKTPAERQQIREAMHLIPGVTTEEVESELPGPSTPTDAGIPGAEGAPAPAAPVAPPAKPKGKGKKQKTMLAPEVDPTFAAALEKDVTANSPMTDESPMGPTLKLLGIPGSDPFAGGTATSEAAGDIAAPAEQAAGPTAPTRGGKFVVKRNGITVHEYDEPLQREKSQMAINSALGGLRDAARTDRERSAADAALKAGANLLDGGVDLEKSARFALDTYNRAVNTGEFKKTYPQTPGGGGGPAGPTKTEIKLGAQSNEDYHKVINETKAAYKFQGAVDSQNFASRALSMMKDLGTDSDTGLRNLDAFKSYLVSMSGKVVTDAEMGQFLGGAGYLSELQTKMGRVVNGQFDEQFMNELRDLFEKINTESVRQRDQAGQAAHDALLNLGVGGSDMTKHASTAYKYFSGHDMPGDEAPAAGAPGKPATKTSVGIDYLNKRKGGR